jgi:hypothetical protein
MFIYFIIHLIPLLLVTLLDLILRKRLRKVTRSLIANILLLLTVTFLYIIDYVLINGFWGEGPYITDRMTAVFLISMSLWGVILINVKIFKGRILNKRKLDLFMEMMERRKMLSAIIVVLLLGALINPISWVYYYYVPKYSHVELSEISLKQWEVLPSSEKYRIGQSFYIHWKGGTRGYFSAKEYINLIDQYEELPDDKKAYMSVEGIVFGWLSGV